MDEILNLIESVSEGFPSYFSHLKYIIKPYFNYRVKQKKNTGQLFYV